jgi:hypothetical protein
MASEIGRFPWDHHQVAGPRSDVVVATGAQVGLGRLERLDPPNLDVGVEPRHPKSAHASSTAITTKAATTIT